jgi:hypothetical protein
MDRLHTRQADGGLKQFGRLVSEQLAGGKDLEIYNDADFYQTLLKDFLASNESNGPSHQAEDGQDDIYADGADLGMTQRFLERRRKL